MVSHASNASPANAANATQSRFSIAIASIQGLRNVSLLRPHTPFARFGAHFAFHPNSGADCFYSRALQRFAAAPSHSARAFRRSLRVSPRVLSQPRLRCCDSYQGSTHYFRGSAFASPPTELHHPLTKTLELMTRIELVTSPLPRECSTN
jgi:hypothetical protein